jgi:hypothetical protein
MHQYDPAETGCTAVGCGTQNTATVDGVWGRRCARHPPRYSPGQLLRLLNAGDIVAANAYLGTWRTNRAGQDEATA